MKVQLTPKKIGVLAFLLCLSGTAPIFAQATTPTKPDNTAVNQRDRNPGEVTADQQKMNPTDRDLTAKIRKSIMADKTLSTYAHNVKIISQSGMVTVKGPVRSDDERRSILAKAADVAGGADKVSDEMSVKPSSKQ